MPRDAALENVIIVIRAWPWLDQASANRAHRIVLTLTQMYNVLERLKAIEAAASPSPLAGEGGEASKRSADGEPGEGLRPELQIEPDPSPASLRSAPSPARGEGRGASVHCVAPPTPAEEAIKDKGLILILKELHERLDVLVFEAYGWLQTLSDEEILERLVALNHERAAEEKRGHVRWLRPDYQIPRFGKQLDSQAAKEEGAQIAAVLDVAAKEQKPSFPGRRCRANRRRVCCAGFGVASTRRIGHRGAIQPREECRKEIEDVLMSLARLGHVSTRDGRSFEIRRAA